jgi:fumarate reductase (CoM/CoB) subunit A
LELALMAGADLINMEQVQFYPCGLVHPPSLHGFILGIQEYAKLYNAHNERFMARYEPELLEHTTRDRLARGIYTEIAEGRATEHGGVFLDATELPEETYRSFKYELEICAERGFDYRRQRVEIAPSAHYFMGGISIDSDAQTTVAGLFAAGEVTGGVQGGNRLSGNSLSEIMVFGSRAGVSAVRHAAKIDRSEPDKDQVSREESRLQQLLTRGAGELTAAQAKDRLRAAMQKYVGVVRTANGLETAVQSLEEIEQEVLPQVGISGSQFHQNYSVLAYLECEKMVKVARTIAAAARTRKESRGAHYVEDYPELDTTSPPNCTLIRIEGGELRTGMRPVVITELQPTAA